MIARCFIPILLAVVLSDWYIDRYYFRHRYPLMSLKRLLWWLPCVVMAVYTCALSMTHGFVPEELFWLNLYLLLVGIIVGPKTVFVLCSAIGKLVRRYITHSKTNWGTPVGVVLGLLGMATYLYGYIWGVAEIKVRHVDIAFADLPEAFDGYKIVQTSDLHLGTFRGWRHQILCNEMDSVRAQHADLVVFTGDLQNMLPEEVDPEVSVLRQPMRGKDGTIAILGNHDYGQYAHATPAQAQQMRRHLLHTMQKNLGWMVLLNQYTTITKQRNGQTDSIIICGEENDGKPPFPQVANLPQTTHGLHPSQFVIMLQHDPWAWRKHILPSSTAQLTLSGHTHGGQMQIMGLRPTMINNREDWGLYEEQGRYLYVTAGLGGVVPFRLNMPNEITVITLHKKQ